MFIWKRKRMVPVPEWAYKLGKRLKDCHHSEDEIRQSLIKRGLSFEQSFVVIEKLDRERRASYHTYLSRLGHLASYDQLANRSFANFIDLRSMRKKIY